MGNESPRGAPACCPGWGLGTGLSLSLDLFGDVFDGHALKELLALDRVVAAAGSELIQKANGVHDTKLLDEGVCGTLGQQSNGLKLCTHSVTSGTRPSIDTTLQARPFRDRAFLKRLSSQISPNLEFERLRAQEHEISGECGRQNCQYGLCLDLDSGLRLVIIKRALKAAVVQIDTHTWIVLADSISAPGTRW